MKTFYLLLANNVVAMITNFTVWFALTYFTFLQTHSVFMMSMISGIYLVTTALSGFWFGSYVDHHVKKQSMTVSSAVSLIAFVASFAVYVAAPENGFNSVQSPWLWTMIPLVMAGVLAGNLRNIAMPTAVTLLVPADRRDKANGIVGAATGSAFVIVSVISGLMVAWGGMFYALLMALILTSAVLVHIIMLQVPEPEIVHSEDAPKAVDISGTFKVVRGIEGLFALILFTTFNNFLGGVFMALMDAYGLSMMTVEQWGFLWGLLSLGFIVGGAYIAKKGLGAHPLRALFRANITIWAVCAVFTIQPSVLLLSAGIFIYMAVAPFIEAAEHTVIQRVVPANRQGRVFGFAQSIEMAASPLTAFLIGPIAEFFFVPFMTDGTGARLIGSWYGVGYARGLALVFTLSGLIGLVVALLGMRSRFYKILSAQYAAAHAETAAAKEAEATAATAEQTPAVPEKSQE